LYSSSCGTLFIPNFLDEEVFVDNETQFYLFIDSENISFNLIEPVFNEILKYGIISGKRAYADWSNPAYKNWPEVLDKYGIRPFQQFHYDSDETDKAIIMDIMEVVYSNKNITGICIIGNDHIYGSVARRVREKGLYFLGIGTKKASKKFVDACNSFIYLDNIKTEEALDKTPHQVQKEAENAEPIMHKAISEIDEDYFTLAALGNMLKKLDPAFDPRTYGYKKLIDLVSSMKKIVSVKTDNMKPPVHYIEVIKK